VSQYTSKLSAAYFINSAAPIARFSSLAISQVLGGGHVLLIGNVIEQDFMQGMQWNAGSGLSFVLMIFVIVSMTIVNIFDKEGEGTSIC
jgi:spermidine/putrescine transport system permease protein